MHPERMNDAELRATLALASVFGLRMLGMFLILPVFVLYATDLPGATPALMGLALGIYGLTQGLLQIPFGWLSDRVGRKPVITVGLLLFAAGSVVAALAPDMGWTIAGRALQGAGAVAAVLTALLADLTRDGVRTRAMAVVGITIGASFGLSLVLGPVLDAWFGVRGIFWLTAVLAGIGIAVVWGVVPAASPAARAHDADGGALLAPGLLRLDAGIFVLHAVLMALFIVLPPALAEMPQLAARPHAWLYLPVLMASVILMLPLVFANERPRWRVLLQRGAILLLAAALATMGLGYGQWWPMVLALLAFFTAFNFLEASLPAAVSRVAPERGRGLALGVYSSSQFLGAFAGGALGGVLWGRAGGAAVLFAAAALALAWFAVVRGK
jgi:MFS family permease